MALALGSRLGPYEILSALGAGGMGEVYRARDTRLARTVAIKVLPADTAADASARARFEREARAIAGLSHPHICVVHDVGHQDGIDYLVMELLEGETLFDRLAKAKGPLPLDQVLSFGVAIADALDKAHRAGIVHRDLKPANVMLTKSGPKLLDFGLAKRSGGSGPLDGSGRDGGAYRPDLPDRPGLSTSPTLVSPARLTGAGTILGTIHYMAPEQVEGREADPRTDIWALGALLYEMATGQRPFEGESAASIIGAILKDTPPALSTRQPLTPPMLERIVHKSLAKDPDERWQSAKDLHDELKWVQEGAAGSVTSSMRPEARLPERIARFTAVAAVFAVLVLAVAAMWYLRARPAPTPPETRLDIVTAATDQLTSFALSPDGRQIVFVATAADGGPRLWLRALSTTTAQPLAGTDGAAFPFWSPDSRSLGFFSDGKLKRLDLGGDRVPQVLATAVPRGGTWNADGVILFSTTTGSPLFRVPAAGGPAVAVTTLNRQTSHRFPLFLPDGRHFLFLAQGARDTAGIHLGSLDSPDTHLLTPAGAAGAYLPSGWLLWERASSLVAQRLDLERQALVGGPQILADSLAFDAAGGSGEGSLSTSATGLVAYRSGGAIHRLVWSDRSGRSLGPLGAPDGDGLMGASLSPDGQRVAEWRGAQRNVDIWLLDGTRTSRLTVDEALDRFPVWSPDGRRIAFESNRTGHRDLYLKPASGGTEELLLASPQDKLPTDWSADGRFLLYQSTDPQTDRDIWVMPLDGARTPKVFLKTGFSERQASFSPDGRWVAYMSNESGRDDVYIRPFTADPSADQTAVPGEQWQVSTDGGVFPRWRADGRELYYLRPGGEMMAVAIQSTGSTMSPGPPVALFSTHVYGRGVDNQQGRHYGVSRDGRFLINTVQDDAPTPITLLTNWQPDAKK